MKKDDQLAKERFREWTTGQSFVLMMGKTQVAVLVALHASLDLPEHIGAVKGGHPKLRNWVIPMRGLYERGLVKDGPYHSWPANSEKKQYMRYKVRDVWEITEAGLLVVSLLKLAGLYQPLVEEFRAHDARARLRLA